MASIGSGAERLGQLETSIAWGSGDAVQQRAEPDEIRASDGASQVSRVLGGHREERASNR